MKLCNLAAVAAAIAAVSCGAPKSNTTELFNGKDLEGWTAVLADDSIPASEVFKAEDGCLFIGGQPFGYIYTAKEYSDFVFEAEYCWVGEATNSGVFLYIKDLGNPFPHCSECNLQAGKAGDFVLLGGAMLDEYVEPEGGLTSKFPKMVKFEESSEKPVGEWNTVKIETKDGHIKVYINDVLQNEGTNPDKVGRIGLQSEGGPIKFRNIRITE